MAGRSPRSAFVGAALVLCVATLPSCDGGSAGPPPVRITIGDAPHEVAPGTTLGQVIARLSLHPHPGRLLSVSGSVLEAAFTPGAILLNGDPAPARTRLRRGDAIVVADGRDRTEGTRTTVDRLPGRHLGDPELSLRRYRIRRVTVRGRISGEVVSVREVATGRPVVPRTVALTFDDGPWPVQTGEIVRVLERHHVHATFFMVGYLVDRYPGIVRMVARAGMRIGDHSWDHPLDPPLADLSDERVADEIGRVKTTLASLGVQTGLFRPPGGSYDDYVIQQARLLAMRVVTWDVDPKDWTPGATSRQIVRRVLGAVHPGSIVLLHDGGGDRRATIRALPRIIRGIRKMGLRLVTIPNRA